MNVRLRIAGRSGGLRIASAEVERLKPSTSRVWLLPTNDGLAARVHRTGSLIYVLGNEFIVCNLLAASVQKPIHPKVLRDSHQKNQHEEIAEETRSETHAISAEERSSRAEEFRDSGPADNSYQRDQITELDVTFAIAVYVVNVPADEEPEACRSPEHNRCVRHQALLSNVQRVMWID